MRKRDSNVLKQAGVLGHRFAVVVTLKSGARLVGAELDEQPDQEQLDGWDFKDPVVYARSGSGWLEVPISAENNAAK